MQLLLQIQAVCYFWPVTCVVRTVTPQSAILATCSDSSTIHYQEVTSVSIWHYLKLEQALVFAVS